MDTPVAVNDRAVLVREGTCGQPLLFLVHDEIGSIAYGSTLARHLSPEITLYGLPVATSVLEGRETLQEMALRMVAMIRDVQSQGPYRVLGYSLGGVLAYEIAAHLIGEDQLVTFLGLLDSAYSLSPELPSQEKIRERLTLYHKESPQPSEIIEVEIERALKLSQILVEAITHYRPQTIRVPVFLLPSPKSVEKSDIHCGWEQLLSRESLNVIPVLGTNFSISQGPNVPLFGRVISKAIRDAGVANYGREKQQHIPRVSLQTGRPGGAPLFCVPGAGATVVCFTNLIGRLGRDWRVFGLQPQGMDGLSIPHSSLGAAVTSYIKAIEEIHSDGPLHLLGHSYGGWAVFEMACRLCSVGRVVASITIIDSMVPNSRLPLTRRHTHGEILKQWLDVFEMLLEQPLGIRMTDLENLSLKDQLVRIHERLLYWRLMPKNSNPDALRGPFHTFAAAMRSRYTPKYTLHGAVRFVIVDDPKLDYISNQRTNQRTVAGWREWAPDLQVFQALGNHMSVLKEPHVNALGDWLCGELSSRCRVLARTH